MIIIYSHILVAICQKLISAKQSKMCIVCAACQSSLATNNPVQKLHVDFNYMLKLKH